jgi:hypothetical protein
MELLNFEQQEKYEKELADYNRKEERHNKALLRNAKKNQWEKYKKLRYGKKPIG